MAVNKTKILAPKELYFILGLCKEGERRLEEGTFSTKVCVCMLKYKDLNISELRNNQEIETRG